MRALKIFGVVFLSLTLASMVSDLALNGFPEPAMATAEQQSCQVDEDDFPVALPDDKLAPDPLGFPRKPLSPGTIEDLANKIRGA
jgi:hypothetical protein